MKVEYQRKIIDLLSHSIQPSPAISSSSSQRVTRSKVSRGKVDYSPNFVNGKVNDFILDLVVKNPPTREGVEPLIEKLRNSFKWYPPNVETGSGTTLTKQDRAKLKTTTMWYNCNGTE